MLELKNIVKTYECSGEDVHALKGVDIKFRSSEFVSVLGPSGCGKTTLLNIIGGLDKYTEGDLIINGRSTKSYKDRDWDSYRNHSVGFVFQNYNLIPHQSVLQNVELALTLSGVSKSERKKRAKEALEAVGLGNQLKKRPSEMSGGQIQRVAIARAIVNNPDIILADEPTGALDTETSVAVMEILKKISKDRLVIMVTHNPDLAERYSTRIIKILDGLLTDDSMPLSEEEINSERELERQLKQSEKQKKSSMSLSTSFGLSLKNLFTKKGRTMLTSFAGSIGIIGIALIIAVSQGTTNYIDTVQEDTLSSYPLTLESTHMDLGTLIQTFTGKAKSGTSHENDAVYQKSIIYDLINSWSNLDSKKNDLTSFKEHLENELKNSDSKLGGSVSGVSYTYDNDFIVYTKGVDGDVITSDTQELMQDIIYEYMGMDMSSMMSMRDSSMSGTSSLFSSGSQMKMWQEMLSGNNGELISPVLKKQYDVVYGNWPEAYNEVVLVLDQHNELDDLTLYALGLKSKDDIDKIMKASIEKGEVEFDNSKKWTYEEICNGTYRTVLGSDCYSYDEKTGLYNDLRESSAGMKYLYDNGIDIKVAGIIKPNEDAVSTMLTGAIGYTKDLTNYLIEEANGSDVCKAQQDSPNIDIFTGLPFKDETSKNDAEKSDFFRSYVATLSTAEKAKVYVKVKSIPDDATVQQQLDAVMANFSREAVQAQIGESLTSQINMSADEIQKYIDGMTDDELRETYSATAKEGIIEQYKATVEAQLSLTPEDRLAMALDAELDGYTNEQCLKYYSEAIEFSEHTYKENMNKIGAVNLNEPSTVNLYANSFENKDIIEEGIADYNNGVSEEKQISYTDYVGILMSSVTTIIDAITYVLIAFVAVSLIVSSIMIGVITLISVQERTKEIGILRAIGASKRNVSGMFNAETVLIGFSSGLLGVLITYLLCIPINIILHQLTGIPNLSASLPVYAAIILVIISCLLTLIAGIIPSRSAAKKDPVVALRTE